jgi:hypothetical protein
MVFDPSATQAERDYYQIADTLIQAFLRAKFPEQEQQDVEDHELEITETDSKGNTILLYGKDEDGRLVNRLSLDMVKNLQELKDAPVGAEIEGMPAVTVKVDGEVFLATDQDGIVVENKQSPALDAISSLEVGAYGLRAQAEVEVETDVETQPTQDKDATVLEDEQLPQSQVLSETEVASSQFVGQVPQASEDFTNQFDFLLSAPVGTDLPLGEITIKSGDQIIFQTDAQGKVISNQMFPDDQDNIEDFQLDSDLDLDAQVEAELQSEASIELEQERSEQVRQQVESLSWVDDMLVDEPESTQDEYSQEETSQQIAADQQIDEILDEAYEAMTEPEEPESVAEERLEFEALVDLFSMNIQELVDRETYAAATKAILAEPEREETMDPLGAFFEGFSTEQRAEIQAQADLQISQVPFEEVQASESVSVPANSIEVSSPESQQNQPPSTYTQVSVEQPTQVSMGSNVQEPQSGNGQSYQDDKPRDGLSAIASALEAIPPSPTKDAMVGLVANMQEAKQQQDKAPDAEMEAFVARRKDEPQNQQWWQKVSQQVESTFTNVRDSFQNWRAATTLNKLAQSQALQSGESYEAAGYNLSREGNQYTLSDKEGNPKLRFESTVLGVKVDKSLPPLSSGDFAKTQQLRADLDASKQPSGAFTHQAIHEGQYLGRVNHLVKALSDYAKSQGGNARVDGKLSYDFRSNAQGSVMISDKEGNVLLAAGNGHLRSRMDEKDLAHFEKMIPALSQSNSRTQAAVVAAAPPAATAKKSKGLEL